MSRVSSFSMAAAVAVSVLVVVPLAASAAGSSAAAPKGGIGVHHRTPISERGGYVASGAVGDHASVTGSWTIADVECLTDDDSYSPYIGLDSATEHWSKQVGVRTDCAAGNPRHKAWVQVPGATRMYLRNRVSTGDVIAASVQSSSDSVTLTVEDLTQGWTRLLTESVGSASSTAESAVAVIASPADRYPSIPSVEFTNVEIDGQPLAAFSATRYRAGTFDGRTLYAPTRLSRGTDFTIEQREQ